MSGIGDRFTGWARDPETVARRLLGQRLVRIVDGRRRSGIIVETEAYLGTIDRAAHSWNGRRTPRVRSMYLAGGHAYVYRIYGLHDCFNVVCGRAGDPVAVLVRALFPEEGIDAMRAARGGAAESRLCAGPGMLTAALAIDRSLDGADLRDDPRIAIERVTARSLPARRILRTPRIGLGDVGAWAAAPLRFVVADGAAGGDRRAIPFPDAPRCGRPSPGTGTGRAGRRGATSSAR